jgi:pimeloyl-ACP methyl ester carboxylesterase
MAGYDDTGEGGTPLVLLHGFGAERSVWDPIVRELAGRRVIRLDLRGSGESESGAGPALMEQLAGDLAELLDALQVERAAIVGHSLGGYVTFAFFRMYAERVAGLALVASHARGDSPELAATREALARAAERDGSMDAIVEFYRPRLVAPQRNGATSGALDDVTAMMARQDPRGAAQLLRGMKERLDSRDLFADVAVPAVVIAGGEDALIPLEVTREVAEGISGARFVLLEDVGHSVMVEAPERAAAALAAFAGTIDG